MEKCFPSYGSESQKVCSLKGEFLCLVCLQGEGNPEPGYSGIQQEQCCVPGRRGTSGWRGRERQKPGWGLRKVQVGEQEILEEVHAQLFVLITTSARIFNVSDLFL